MHSSWSGCDIFWMIYFFFKLVFWRPFVFDCVYNQVIFEFFFINFLTWRILQLCFWWLDFIWYVDMTKCIGDVNMSVFESFCVLWIYSDYHYLNLKNTSKYLNVQIHWLYLCRIPTCVCVFNNDKIHIIQLKRLIWYNSYWKW